MARKPTKQTANVGKAGPESSNLKRKQGTSTRPRKAAITSRYFNSDTGDDDDSEDDASSAGVEDGGGSEDVDEPSSEEEQPRRKRRAPATANKNEQPTPKSAGKGNELWRQGVKTGLAPGTQIVIKKPKPRTAGSTQYADDTIHPNTMLFLGDLKANNDREWLKMYDADYRKSLSDWNSFVEASTEKLVEIDDTIPELPLKDVVFRIYRDIRFSKDPTPYKPYFSAAWSRTGRKGPYAAYYLQISPNDSFIGGGYWAPDAGALAALRGSIDRHPERLKEVLMNDRVRHEFLRDASKKGAAKAFVESNAASALKTKPKGYDAGHPDIDLLRLRRFTIGRKLTDAEVVDAQVLHRIAELFSAMHPFIAFLNHIVLPDPGEENDDDEEEEEAEVEEDGDSETAASEI